MTGTTAHTPLIRQYLEVKSKHPDSLLFFRVGDFYEMFFDDAEVGSRLLGITLTSRNNGSSDVPLAGVPVKALGEYLPRLVREGRRVAICEQVEDASQAEGLVRREVTEVVTPGATLDENLLAAGRNNFVAGVGGLGGEWLGIATADLSTGECEVWECRRDAVADELGRLEPAELLVPGNDAATDLPAGRWVETVREAWRFSPDVGVEALRRVYGVSGIGGFGLDVERDGHLIGAIGAVLSYLEEARPTGLPHLRTPRVHRRGRYLYLDEMTRRNLELVEPLRAGEGATLLSVLDQTRTAMGRRALRRRLLRPLTERAEIEARLEAVSEFVESPDMRAAVCDELGRIRDLERLTGRLAAARVAPRELLSLADSLAALPELTDALAAAVAPRLATLRDELDGLEDVRERIETTVDPDAPASLGDGGVVRPGCSGALDDLRAVRDGALEAIAGLQATEREATGIDNLKIGYNKVFGYYIEVTRSHLAKVPERYQRKQTLSNAERYVTPELKEWEQQVVEAEIELAELEAEIFRELRAELAGRAGRIQAAAERVAEIDVHAALAEVADRGGYVRPVLHDEFGLEIRAGRHPVVESMVGREAFIPNDVVLDEESFVMILTGPNMSGKSTVLRQVGLIVLMAQIGSFVPADAARIGISDRVFTRVGASDSLSSGHSTFMVEMTETATILNGATDRSLVLLDEIGRGTSTYDGVAIAWAVTEYVHERIGARTIFATHYHELVELADSLDGVSAWNVAVRETGDDIVFLRRLERGGCDRSYGVQVARLAGIPAAVVDRAFDVLHELEHGPGGGTRLSHLADLRRDQLSLFERRESALRERIAGYDTDDMTPLDALVALADLKRLADEE
ncbi:MAG TPA: DNA mismatch repair protein MutS [Gemmatimonadota bacterium]|nr:DNA mismatch repair protein MutS [Gemmatimonadota bacterium]